MENLNTKVYLAISGAVILLLLLILLIPFSKKNPIQSDKISPTSQLFPTTIETNPSPSSNNDQPLVIDGLSPTPIVIEARFTGVFEEELPQVIIDFDAQKYELQQKLPLSLSTFSIDFDYGQDRFVVSLKDPKSQAQKEFESWRVANYSKLSADQFLLK